MRFIAVEVNDGFGRVAGSVSLELAGRGLQASHSINGDGEIVLTLATPGNDGRQLVLTISPADLDALLDAGQTVMSDPRILDALAAGGE